MSSMTVCANGTMNAPATPGNNRNATISGRVVAMPHNMDAMTNRTTEKRKRLRDHTLPASQPVTDRKRDVWGQSVTGRGDLGGSRIITNKKKQVDNRSRF